MCRVLAFFDCPHRSIGASDMEDKLARLFYGRGGNYPSHIRPTPDLADSILKINESFIASKFLVRGYLVSIHEDARLGSRAWQVSTIVKLQPHLIVY
ncbi:hypothetical protein GGR58DRAFT_406524 [Xylaria digitata]|nr:hypothetical protein GGR58DRAFT_406524 [Xylaria digitata]